VVGGKALFFFSTLTPMENLLPVGIPTNQFSIKRRAILGNKSHKILIL